MNLTMTKRLEFDAGHRLLNHESKCAHLHGHRYAVEVTLELLGGLDVAGRITDFGVVKSRFGGWLDEHLDHAFIANAEDPICGWLIEHNQRRHIVPFEPSAENLALYLRKVAADLLDESSFRVVSVVVFETPTSSAEAHS